MSANDREYEQDPEVGTAAPALVGGFAYDRARDRWSWSTEVYRIHGFEPHDVVPTTELMRYHLHTNVKVRFLAECLVSAASQDRTRPAEAPGLTVDEVYRIFSAATSGET